MGGRLIKQNNHEVNPKISNGEERELMNYGRDEISAHE